MFQLIANVLAFFYSWTHNYIFSIALLTISIMVLLMPLTLKGTKSMLELQKLQPEIRRLQAEHKGDRQKMNEEMMKLYQEHKINPLGGCLPLLLQAPVFIVLYRVLSKLTQPEDGFEPSYISEDSELYQSLVGQTQMLQWGLDLSKPATEIIADDFVAGIPYLILVLAVAVTSYIQQWQISARTKNQQANRQQQLIMKALPVFFAVISLTLPSALIIYFLTSNLFRIAQQAYITRRFYRDQPEVVAEVAPKAPKPAPKAPAKPAPAAGSTAKPAPRHQKPSGRVTPPKGSATPARPAPRTRPSTPDPKKKK
jgi:YidC/Oxa1 family membrane protein insertase